MKCNAVQVFVVLIVILHCCFGQNDTEISTDTPKDLTTTNATTITTTTKAPLPDDRKSYRKTTVKAKTSNGNETEHNTADNAISGFNDLESWQAPLEIVNNYPMFLSGYDDENRPIWVAELGKFDMRKLVEGGKETMDLFSKYVKKLIVIMLKSIKDRSTEEMPVDRGIFLIDFDDMKLIQLAHLPTITYCLKLMKEYRHLIEDHMAKVYIVNANFVAESGLNLARPILGHMFDRFEIYGTNKDKWLPHILHALPKDQLPEWYGGNKGHTPLLVYG